MRRASALQPDSGTDFIDNAATNKVVTAWPAPPPAALASSAWVRTSRSCRSVRILEKLINVLADGSSNLTLADTNEEAANTRRCPPQSIAVSRARPPNSRAERAQLCANSYKLRE